MIDRKKKKGKFKLLNFKKNYIVSAVNVPTNRRKIKQEELMQLFTKNRIGILGIVDHKIIHDDPIEYHEKQNVTFITTSTTTNANSEPIGGLGLLINRTSSAALAEIKLYNTRILITHFNGNPATTIIIQYTPVEGTTDSIDQYEHLSVITRTVPKNNGLLVIGNCNPHLGPEIRFTLFMKTNNNDKLLLDYSLEVNLIIANTRFQKNEGKSSPFCPK